jgi:hypothetical protein
MASAFRPPPDAPMVFHRTGEPAEARETIPNVNAITGRGGDLSAVVRD